MNAETDDNVIEADHYMALALNALDKIQCRYVAGVRIQQVVTILSKARTALLPATVEAENL